MLRMHPPDLHDAERVLDRVYSTDIETSERRNVLFPVLDDNGDRRASDALVLARRRRLDAR